MSFSFRFLGFVRARCPGLYSFVEQTRGRSTRPFYFPKAGVKPAK